MFCPPIDEAGKYSLTKFPNRSGNIICNKESDHRTLILEISFRWDSSNDNDRIEIFNYENNEDFAIFQSITEKNQELDVCFDETNEDIGKIIATVVKNCQETYKNCF